MRIKQLEVFGFRGIKRGTICFDKQSVLVGPNGCGKSTVIDALSLVLARDRFVRTLTEHDFFNSTPQPGDRLRFIATLGDFPGNSCDQNSNWFREGRAVPKWWNSQSKTLLSHPTSDEDLLCAQIGYAARFDIDTLSVETIRYFHDDNDLVDPFDSEGIVRVPHRLVSDIGFFPVPATRTWDRMASFGSDLFKGLVNTLEALPSDLLLQERDRLRKPENPIEQEPAFREIVKRIEARYADLLPNKTRFHLRVTDTDSDALLRSLLPHYGRSETAPPLPAGRQGTGFLSIQTLTLLLEFGRARRAAGKNFIIAIEEPELHLPPGLQRSIMFQAFQVADQVICTTHSPRVASFAEATQISVLDNPEGSFRSIRLLDRALTHEATNAERKLFLDSRSLVVEALMHPAVLIPEGRIDFEWLRLLSSLLGSSEGYSKLTDEERRNSLPFVAMIGMIPTHDAALPVTWERLGRIHRHVVVLVDGDTQGDLYIANLIKVQPPPRVILQWGDGQTIEDIIDWLVAPEKEAILPVLQNVFTGKYDFSEMDEFLHLLKTERKESGMKGDYLAYEDVVSCLGDYATCVKRVSRLLGVLTQAILHTAEHGDELKVDGRSIDGSQVLRWHSPE